MYLLDKGGEIVTERKKENNYLEFKNPIHIVWRKGTPEDPYVDKLDIMKVVNQRVILSEIPDYLTRVKIPNMKEINHERFIKDTLEKDEFYCDYTNGFVYFHASMEADTVSVRYKARGLILYPSTRIAHINGDNVKETLYELIEKTTKQVEDLKWQTSEYEEYLKRLVESLNNAELATDNANNSARHAENVAKDLEKAGETTKLEWKPPVAEWKDIEITYPNPQIGWTTQVEDTGERYRWDGKEWVHIDSISTAIPLATENTNGAMSKEDFVKLKGISPDVNYKTIVFVLPQENFEGIQDPHVIFPHKGEIEELQITVTGVGKEDTTLVIEKSNDFIQWESITKESIVIPANSNYALPAEVKLKEVLPNEIFRVRIAEAGWTSNISININISLDTE